MCPVSTSNLLLLVSLNAQTPKMQHAARRRVPDLATDARSDE